MFSPFRLSGGWSPARTFSAAAIVCLLLAPAIARADAPPFPEPHWQTLATVLPELRRGGYVIYMRHGLTDTNQAAGEGGDLARCETQRNLSDAGRAQEAGVGRGIRALRVPIGKVVSSPFCRCKDTATLAFGHYDVSPDLHFALNAPAEERQRLATVLRNMLGAVPAAGTNDVIVAHNANLREAVGIWPKPEGVAYVFKPLGNGRFEPVAKVLPDDWMAVAASAAKP